jgi:hypothetical protein
MKPILSHRVEVMFAMSFKPMYVDASDPHLLIYLTFCGSTQGTTLGYRTCDYRKQQ